MWEEINALEGPTTWAEVVRREHLARMEAYWKRLAPPRPTPRGRARPAAQVPLRLALGYAIRPAWGLCHGPALRALWALRLTPVGARRLAKGLYDMGRHRWARLGLQHSAGRHGPAAFKLAHTNGVGGRPPLWPPRVWGSKGLETGWHLRAGRLSRRCLVVESVTTHLPHSLCALFLRPFYMWLRYLPNTYLVTPTLLPIIGTRPPSLLADLPGTLR